MADERSLGCAAGSVAASFRTRDRSGSGMAAGGDGAAIRLQPGGVGAAVRSQRELGITATGIGRAFARGDSAASAHRQDRRSSGDEVPGAGGTKESGGLPAHGRDLRRASLRCTRSRVAVCGVAPGNGRDPSTHSRRSSAVFQNAAAGGDSNQASRRSDPRPGDGSSDPGPRPSAAGRRGGVGTR